jgi:hypothetical protein
MGRHSVRRHTCGQLRLDRPLTGSTSAGRQINELSSEVANDALPLVHTDGPSTRVMDRYALWDVSPL